MITVIEQRDFDAQQVRIEALEQEVAKVAADLQALKDLLFVHAVTSLNVAKTAVTPLK
jgi:hypothetical protein